MTTSHIAWLGHEVTPLTPRAPPAEPAVSPAAAHPRSRWRATTARAEGISSRGCHASRAPPPAHLGGHPRSTRCPPSRARPSSAHRARAAEPGPVPRSRMWWRSAITLANVHHPPDHRTSGCPPKRQTMPNDWGALGPQCRKHVSEYPTVSAREHRRCPLRCPLFGTSVGGSVFGSADGSCGRTPPHSGSRGWWCAKSRSRSGR
jgi:hypothetical protein